MRFNPTKHLNAIEHGIICFLYRGTGELLEVFKQRLDKLVPGDVHIVQVYHGDVKLLEIKSEVVLPVDCPGHNDNLAILFGHPRAVADVVGGLVAIRPDLDRIAEFFEANHIDCSPRCDRTNPPDPIPDLVVVFLDFILESVHNRRHCVCSLCFCNHIYTCFDQKF